MATAIQKAIAQDTNSITDNMTRRAVQKVANQLNEGQYGPKISGVAITSTAAELNKLDGVSVTATEMDQRVFNVKLEDASVAQATYSSVPFSGNITTIYAVITGTSPASGSTFSFGMAKASIPSSGSVAFSGNTIYLGASGASAATGASVTCTASAALSVTAGDVMRFSSDGNLTGPTMDVVFTVVTDIT